MTTIQDEGTPSVPPGARLEWVTVDDGGTEGET